MKLNTSFCVLVLFLTIVCEGRVMAQKVMPVVPDLAAVAIIGGATDWGTTETCSGPQCWIPVEAGTRPDVGLLPETRGSYA